MSRTEPHQFMVTVDVPVGYKILDYREPRAGESYLSAVNNGVITQGPDCFRSPRFILEKVVSYRKPVMPDDYGKEIEVWDHVGQDCAKAQLCAIRKQTPFKFVTEVTAHIFARIKVED